MKERDAREVFAAWRVGDSWPWERSAESAELREYVGTSFPATGRLLHPLFEDLSVGNWEHTWPDSESDPIGRGELEHSFPARGLKWHDLAEDLDVEYRPGMSLRDYLEHLPAGMWPRALVGPSDGTLDMERWRHVLRLTREAFAPERCVFAWAKERCFGGRARAFEGSLAESVELFDGEFTMGSPTLFFDVERRFLLVTPPDRPWSAIAGEASWLGLLCEHKPLDAEALDGATRLSL